MPDTTVFPTPAPIAASHLAATSATYTATLYVPGKPARLLQVEELADLLCPTAPNGLLSCFAHEVEKLLEVQDADVLAVDERAAVWGLANAADYNAPDNQEAQERVWGLFGNSEMVGPVLVVEKVSLASIVPAV
jgi:hypothetical protein